MTFYRSSTLLALLFAAVAVAAGEAGTGVELEPKPATQTDAGKVFRFRGGERIAIQVAENPTEAITQFEQIVTSDGRVSSVRFGIVNVLGKTPEEASKIIADRYRKVTGFREPIVSVQLREVPVQRVFVQGEVLEPKTVVLPYFMDLTLAAVLAEAGGITEDADIAGIKILRRLPGGEVKLETVDATGFARPGETFSGPPLSSGDNVIVPRAESFAVLGEVKRPGIVSRRLSRVPHGVPIRLSHVVATVGGLNPNADRKNIKVIRVDKQGDRQTTVCDANEMEKGTPKHDPVLKDGDQIVVPASEGIMIVGAVNAPGIYYIPVGPPSLSRLVALCGGLAGYAKKKEVKVVRKNTPGKSITVNMEEVIELGRTDKDVLLEPGDLVFVGGDPY